MSMAAAGAGVGTMGNLVQIFARMAAQREMDRAVNRELQRQGFYQQDAWGAIDQNLATTGATQTRAQMPFWQRNAMQGYQAVGGVPATVGQKAPTGREQAWVDLAGALRAPEAAWSEFSLRQMIKNLRTAQQLGVLSQLSRSSASVLPQEVRAAQSSQQNAETWGSLISSLGGGMSSLGATRG